MTEAIREYFQRFRNDITESVYSNMTINDFHRNKAYNDYLDFDRQTIFRRDKKECGIRNIDNSCYLSVTLQLLYNIQSFRERIFSITQPQSHFMNELRNLFAMMYKGSLCYVDPTNIYLALKKSYPSIFVDGYQNDFHQVFTVVLDHIQKTMPSQDDKKFFRKVFYGKSKVNIIDNQSQKYLVENQNTFNIISLPSASGSFERAMSEYRNEKMENYQNQKGEKINAIRETHFLETPGLLSFLVNRVSFKDKKLIKDSSVFQFEQNVLFSKANLNKNQSSSKCKQLQNQIDALNGWIHQMDKNKMILEETMKYLSNQEFQSLDVPSIHNKVGEKQREITKNYLKAQIEEIQLKISKAYKQIQKNQAQKEKIANQNCSELYTLWALMIHSGKNADFGHYKICIKVRDNCWIEFNDRRTYEVCSEKIQQYKANGQVCCIFYKRKNLVCYSQQSKVPASLKKLVKSQQSKLIKNIDHARVLQSIYQQAESANMIWQFQNLQLAQSKYSYFFNPLKHLLLEKTQQFICKGFVLYQMISEPKFMANIKYKLIDPTSLQLNIPKLDFGIPSEYFELSVAIKQFISTQYVSCNPVKAFQGIAFFMDIDVKNKVTLQNLQELRQLLIIKGIFYESVFVEFNLLQSYKSLKVQIDKIVETLSPDSSFSLICITLRSELQMNYEKKSKLSNCYPTGMLITRQTPKILNYQDLFIQRFEVEIKIRPKFISSPDQILNVFKSLYPKYIKKAQK